MYGASPLPWVSPWDFVGVWNGAKLKSYPRCVRVQALTSEIRGTHPPNELRGHGHACDFILIIMAQPDNYNDRDHNHRWGRWLSNLPFLRRVWISEARPRAHLQWNFRSIVLRRLRLGLGVWVLRSGILTPDLNLGPTARTRLRPQPVLAQFNWFFFVFRIFVLARIRSIWRSNAPNSPHRRAQRRPACVGAFTD